MVQQEVRKMNDIKIGLLLSLMGGLGFFFGALNQVQGLTLSILGFVIVYVQSSTQTARES